MKKILLILLILSIGTEFSAVDYTNGRAQGLPRGTKIIYPGGETFILEEKCALYVQKGIGRLGLKFAELNELRPHVTELSNIIRQYEFKEGLYKKALGQHWAHRLQDGAVYAGFAYLVIKAIVKSVE